MVQRKRKKQIRKKQHGCLTFFALSAMFVLCVYMFMDEDRIPQRKVEMKIDITNHVNICEPEEDFDTETSFFDLF